jgi:hypothetical protein
MKGVLAFLILTACAGVVVLDAGCARYGEVRADIPPLGDDDVSRWVAVLDKAMTETCRN